MSSGSRAEPDLVFALFGGALACLLIAAPAHGQADADALDAARACSSLEDDTARLACLDRVLATVPQPAAGVESAAGPAPEPEIAPRSAPVVDAPARVAGSVQDEGAPPAVDLAGTVRIVEIRRNDLGWTTFVTEEGPVLIQRAGAAGRFPATPFDAELRPAMGGSYFLVSPRGGRPIRVTQAR